MTVIYLDRVFLLNGIVDYLLLLSAAALSGITLRRRRLLLCAVGGGLYAVAVFLPGLTLLRLPICKIAAGVLMAFAAYGREAHRWRLMALFFLLSGGLAGVLLAVGLLLGSPGALWKQVYYARINWKIFLGAVVGFSLVLRLLFHQAARSAVRGGGLLPVTIEIDGRKISITALHDTGNTLRSPVSGCAVLVAEKRALYGLWPLEIQHIVGLRSPPEDRLLLLREKSSRFCLLPYQSVGIGGGLLLSVQSDAIWVKDKKYSHALIALSEYPVSTGGGYQALWGESEEKNEKSVSHGVPVADAPVPAGSGTVYRRQRYTAAAPVPGGGGGAAGAPGGTERKADANRAESAAGGLHSETI